MSILGRFLTNLIQTEIIHCFMKKLNSLSISFFKFFNFINFQPIIQQELIMEFVKLKFAISHSSNLSC